MSRRAHQLKKNDGCELMNRMVFIDSESRVDETYTHHPYLVVARFKSWRKDSPTTPPKWHDRIYWDEFTSFWDELDRYTPTGSKTHVFAHNMHYDFSVLHGDREMTMRGWVGESPFDNGPVFVMKYRKPEEKKTVVFLSSTNYYAASLKELGKVFGKPKIEVNVLEMSRTEAEPYCIQDVEILDTAVCAFRDFVRDNDLGTMAITLASQSMNAFRHRFMEHPVFIHAEDDAIQLERDAYFGGRVECFRVGTVYDRLHKLDVNSMYPAQMFEDEVPTKLRWHRKPMHGIEPEVIGEYIRQGYKVCARVTINTDIPAYPKIEDGVLLYPIGEFETSLCTPELELALERGHLQWCTELNVYESAPLFRAYVEWFYPRKRDETDPVLRYMYKIFLNALYGKFGQRAHDARVVGSAEPGEFGMERCFDPERNRWYWLRRFGGIVVEDVIGETPNDREGFNSFPAISAHITSGARVRLWRYIETAGVEHVCYCDTDSIICDAVGYDRLRSQLDDKRLGMLKDEGESDGGVFRNPKDYTFAGVTKRKGISKSAEEIEPGVFRTVQWPSFKGSMRRGNADYQNIIRTKVIDPIYKKGWVDVSYAQPLRYAGNVLQPPPIGAENHFEICARYRLTPML